MRQMARKTKSAVTCGGRRRRWACVADRGRADALIRVLVESIGWGSQTLSCVEDAVQTSGCSDTLARELTAGGYPRVIVRRNGEPSMLAYVRAALVVATLAGAPLVTLQKHVSNRQSS